MHHPPENKDRNHDCGLSTATLRLNWPHAAKPPNQSKRRILQTQILPIQSRLFQSADLICTMKRIAFRLKSTGSLSKAEYIFFGDADRFLENWLKPILKCEWR